MSLMKTEVAWLPSCQDALDNDPPIAQVLRQADRG